MDDTRAFHLAENLRSFADFVDEHAPVLPESIAVDCYSYVWDWQMETDADGVEETIPAVIARAMRAGIKGSDKIRKEYSDSFFRLYMDFGSKVKIQYKIVCNRDEVCEKHVVGTEVVTEKVPPEGEWIEKEVTKEIVEWKCSPLLAVVEGE